MIVMTTRAARDRCIRRRRRYQLRRRRTIFPLEPSFKTALLPGRGPVGGWEKTNLNREQSGIQTIPRNRPGYRNLARRTGHINRVAQRISFKVTLRTSKTIPNLVRSEDDTDT